MDNTSVEIRSPRWLKIFMGIFAVPCFCVAVLSLLSLFMPVFEGKPPTVAQSLFLGVGYFVFGAFLWWPVRRFVIRADENGLLHNSGFFATKVRWSEVASYYSEQSQQTSGRFHLIFLDAQHKILLQVPAGNRNMDQRAIEQWRELTQFVDSQLAGKKVEAPYVSYEPEAMAARSFEVDWKTKTLGWKIARMIGLFAYAAFWCGVSLSLMLYTSLHYPGKPQSGMGLWLGLAAIFSMSVGPLLPHIVWIQIKKRKIAREWEARDKIES